MLWYAFYQPQKIPYHNIPLNTPENYPKHNSTSFKPFHATVTNTCTLVPAERLQLNLLQFGLSLLPVHVPGYPYLAQNIGQ